MAVCSGHGVLVNVSNSSSSSSSILQCLCFPGYTGSDDIRAWNDCHISTDLYRLANILTAFLSFGCALMACVGLRQVRMYVLQRSARRMLLMFYLCKFIYSMLATIRIGMTLDRGYHDYTLDIGPDILFALVLAMAGGSVGFIPYMWHGLLERLFPDPDVAPHPRACTRSPRIILSLVGLWWIFLIAAFIARHELRSDYTLAYYILLLTCISVTTGFWIMDSYILHVLGSLGEVAERMADSPAARRISIIAFRLKWFQRATMAIALGVLIMVIYVGSVTSLKRQIWLVMYPSFCLYFLASIRYATMFFPPSRYGRKEEMTTTASASFLL